VALKNAQVVKENNSDSKREFQSSIPSTKVRIFPSSGETKKKKKNKNPSIYVFGYLLEQCVEIW
jgi:hypothetical protein